MDANEIVKLAIDNNLVLEVYEELHPIVLDEIKKEKTKVRELSAELRLIKKFVNTNNLKVIKDILADD